MTLSGTSLRMSSLLAGGPEADPATDRAQILRMLHDTVLQTLEAMSLPSELDRSAPEAVLAELRGVARWQAVHLRHAMSELTGGRPRGRRRALAATLGTLLTQLGPAGPRVELVAARDLPEVSAARTAAVRDAVREALGNVVKHAGVRQATVRVAAAGRGVEVVVRDNGAGFDTARTPAGFGIRQSITARLREVGGTATVSSWPGRGTRVRLWVPGAAEGAVLAN